jgi:hypothetical protein
VLVLDDVEGYDRPEEKDRGEYCAEDCNEVGNGAFGDVGCAVI